MKEPFYMIVRKRRLALGLSQKAVARAIGLTDAYMSQIESKDGRIPSDDALLRLAEVLKLDGLELLFIARLAKAGSPELEAAYRRGADAYSQSAQRGDDAKPRSIPVVAHVTACEPFAVISYAEAMQQAQPLEGFELPLWVAGNLAEGTYALKLKDRSATRHLPEGATVLVQPIATVAEGRRHRGVARERRQWKMLVEALC